MAILLPNTVYNLIMAIKFQCLLRRHIDAKGFLFKAMEVPARRKMTLKSPDQASICDELGVRMYWKSRKKNQLGLFIDTF